MLCSSIKHFRIKFSAEMKIYKNRYLVLIQ
jgi:hypothetical protein